MGYPQPLRDPHRRDECRHLTKDFLFYCQRNSEVQELARDLSDIIEGGCLAIVEKRDLELLNWNMEAESGSHPMLCFESIFPIALVLCSMIDGACQEFEHVVKFEKSKFNHPVWFDWGITHEYDKRGWVTKVYYETSHWISTCDYTVAPYDGKVRYHETKSKPGIIVEDVEEPLQGNLF